MTVRKTWFENFRMERQPIGYRWNNTQAWILFAAVVKAQIDDLAGVLQGWAAPLSVRVRGS